MTLPKKKGIRKIKDGNIKYYWKVRADNKNNELKITIGKVLEPNKVIILSAKQSDIRPPSIHREDNEIAEITRVTPELIKRTIKFAQGSGWESQEKIRPFRVKLAGGFFEEID